MTTVFIAGSVVILKVNWDVRQINLIKEEQL